MFGDAPVDIQNMIQQILGGLGGDIGQNVTINATDLPNGMEVNINLENATSQAAHRQDQHEIRARIRNIRRFLTMAHSRLNRLNEIQSGAPLDDSQNTAIIVGSIQATATMSDGSVNTIEIDTNPRTIRAADLASFASSHQASTNTTTTSSSQQQQQQQEQEQEQPNDPQHSEQQQQQQQNTSVEVLADVVSSVMTVYDQFRPYLQQYHDMLINDANEAPDSPPRANSNSSTSTNTNSTSTSTSTSGSENRRQRFCNNINDMMHLLGHLFHNLSDLHVNIRERPPRQMHTMNTLQYTSSTIISTVPVEASIQIIQDSSSSSAPSSTQSNTAARGRSQSESRSAAESTAAQDSATTRSRSRPAPTENILSRIAAAAAAAAAAATTSPATPTPTPHIHPTVRVARSSHHSSSSSTNSSYDQFLPCNSVHFYNTPMPRQSPQSFTRRRHPASSQQMPPQQQQQQQQTQMPPPFNLFSQLFTPQATRQSATTTTTTSSAPQMSFPGQLFAATLGGFNPTPSASNQQQIPQINQLFGSSGLLSQILGGINLNQPTAAAASQPQQQQHQPRQQATTNTRPESQAQVANAILRETISLLGSNNPNDQRLNQPLQEFLRALGADPDEINGTGSSSASNNNSSLNLFNVFFSSMTLGDMINLARGQNLDQVFAHSRTPLREYIREHFGIENAENEALVDSLADKLYNEIFVESTGINVRFDELELSDEAQRRQVNLAKSFEKLIKHHLRILIKHVYDPAFSSSSNPSWSAIVVKKFYDLINHLVTLCRYSIRNADAKFTEIVTQKLNQAVMDNDFFGMGLFTNVFNGFISSQVQQMLRNVTMSNEQIEQFLVFADGRNAESNVRAEASTTTLTSQLAEKKESRQEEEKKNAGEEKEEDEEEEEEEDKYDSASSTISGNSMDIDQCVNNYYAESEKYKEKKQQQQQSTLTGTGSDLMPDEW